MTTRGKERRARIFTDKPPACFKLALKRLQDPNNLDAIRVAATTHAAHLSDEALSVSLGEDTDIDAAVRCVIRQIVRLADKMPLANAKKNLIEEFKLPEEVAASMCDAIPERRADIETQLAVKAPVLPRMAELRWRVDVHISNSILRKKMKPNILMQVLFEDGRIKTFECSPEVFQDLRYNVTKLLHEMQRLEVRIEKGMTSRKEEELSKEMKFYNSLRLILPSGFVWN